MIHLAKTLANQTLRAVHGCASVCVCVCVCFSIGLNLASYQNINYRVLELSRAKALPRDHCVLIKNIIQQLRCVFARVFSALVGSWVHVPSHMLFSKIEVFSIKVK